MTEFRAGPELRRTVASRLTPRGRGAVATIGVRGEVGLVDDFFRARNGKRLAEQPLNRTCFGSWIDANGEAEELVLCRTSAETLEIHCHGGAAAATRLLNHLALTGARIVSAEEFQTGTRPLVEVECESALAGATTERTALLLVRQCSRFPAAIRSLVELPVGKREQAVSNLLEWAGFGLHLTTPWKVVLCGRPNVGKSSLINRLVGYNRAVVFDQPGTTRDLLAAQTAVAGWPVELIDTAGQRESDEELEAAGIRKAQNALRGADLVLVIADATAGWTADDERLLTLAVAPLVVWNKIDIADSPTPRGAAPVSARTGEGIDALMQRIVERLVPDVPPEGAAYPVTAEQRGRLEHLHTLCDDDVHWRQILYNWNR